MPKANAPARRESVDARSLRTYLDALFGVEPDGSYVELRWRLRGGSGMGREFVSVRDRRLADVIRARGRATDLYIGVAPRARQEGTRAAVERCHALWVDADSDKAVDTLSSFDPAPAIVVRSGSGRNVHAYWPLWPPVEADALEHANRRLAIAVGADMRATDAARILRPPETTNHKPEARRQVVVERLEVEIFTVDQVVGKLPNPPGRERPSPPGSRPLSDADDALEAIAPAEYVEALTGLVPDRDGKVCCPLHDDRTPSFHVYGSAEHGWYCYGCGLGGGIYQLAAALAGYPLPLRGDDFLRVQQTLGAQLSRAVTP